MAPDHVKPTRFQKIGNLGWFMRTIQRDQLGNPPRICQVDDFYFPRTSTTTGGSIVFFVFFFWGGSQRQLLDLPLRFCCFSPPCRWWSLELSELLPPPPPPAALDYAFNCDPQISAGTARPQMRAEIECQNRMSGNICHRCFQMRCQKQWQNNLSRWGSLEGK